MNPLKFSVNIGLITYPLNTWILVLLGGDLDQEYLFFFSIWKPLWRKTWEESIEPCCAKAPWNSNVSRKRKKKDISPYLMMSWLCRISCEYVQHAFLIMRGYTLISSFCTKIKYVLLLMFLKKIIFTSLLHVCNFFFLFHGWGLVNLLHISQFILSQVLDTFFWKGNL